MKKIDLGQSITILANIGVIAGIVFLAVELRQNNRVLSAQAQFNILQNRTSGISALSESTEVANFWTKVNRDEALSDSERLRVKAYAMKAILNWEWEFGQYQAGNIERDDLPLVAWRNAFHGEDVTRRIDSYPAVWTELRDGLNPEFVLLMERRLSHSTVNSRSATLSLWRLTSLNGPELAAGVIGPETTGN